MGEASGGGARDGGLVEETGSHADVFVLEGASRADEVPGGGVPRIIALVHDAEGGEQGEAHGGGGTDAASVQPRRVRAKAPDEAGERQVEVTVDVGVSAQLGAARGALAAVDVRGAAGEGAPLARLAGDALRGGTSRVSKRTTPAKASVRTRTAVGGSGVGVGRKASATPQLSANPATRPP